MHQRAREEKRSQLLRFRSDHELSNRQMQDFFVVSEAAYNRWIVDYVEVPDPISLAMELYDSGEMPAPSAVKNSDRGAIIERAKTDLALTEQELAEATGFSARVIRKWRSEKPGPRPAWVIAFCGLLKRRYGYDAKLF